jgi:CRP-like cAMP-binding protein
LGILAQQLEVEHYPADTKIVSQGDVGDRLYIIKSGRVEVLVTDMGSVRRVNELSANDYFGEMALLTAEPRVATICSMEPTTLYSLKQMDFTTLLEHEPALKQAIMEVVATRQQALASVPWPIAAE